MKKALELLMVMLAGAVAWSASAATLTDFWSNPQQPGWGMSIVQQDTVTFVALFVHDTGREPRWYVASNTELVGIGAGGLPVFAGPLYRTTGPWNGGPFDPSLVSTVQVGHLSLEALPGDRLRVEYTAEGANVTQEVTRLAFAPIPATNIYDGAMRVLERAVAGGVRLVLLNTQTIVEVQGATARVTILDNLQRTCVYEGAFRQAGSIASMSGAFTCSGRPDQADAGTFDITDIEVTSNGITGAIRTVSPKVSNAGRFGGARF